MTNSQDLSFLTGPVGLFVIYGRMNEPVSHGKCFKTVSHYYPCFLSLLNSNFAVIVFLKQKVLGEKFLLFSLKYVLNCNLKYEGGPMGHPPLFRALWWRGCGCPSQNAEVLALWDCFLLVLLAKPMLVASDEAGPVLTTPLFTPPSPSLVEFRLNLVQESLPVMCLSGRYKNEVQFLLSFSHITLL